MIQWPLLLVRHLEDQKILPTISPKKTYSGLFGGLIGSIVFIYLCELYFLSGFEFSFNGKRSIFPCFCVQHYWIYWRQF